MERFWFDFCLVLAVCMLFPVLPTSAPGLHSKPFPSWWNHIWISVMESHLEGPISRLGCGVFYQWLYIVDFCTTVQGCFLYVHKIMWIISKQPCLDVCTKTCFFWPIRYRPAVCTQDLQLQWASLPGNMLCGYNIWKCNSTAHYSKKASRSWGCTHLGSLPHALPLFMFVNIFLLILHCFLIGGSSIVVMSYGPSLLYEFS